MITRTFKLCLNAGTGSAPYINVSQYDEGETWLFELYSETGERYIPTTGAIVGVKSDGHGIANTGTVDSEGRVVIAETQQMTASAGRAIYELSIDGLTHGTANFIVAVERKPTDDAVMSDSDLSLIQEAVDASEVIVDVIGDSDPSEVIGEHVDAWLDNHPEATTTVLDGAITAPKINNSLWDKLLVSEEASGAVASFEDGADDVPVSSLKVALEPIQTGTGNPSPSNVRPIYPANGKNLLQVTATSQTVSGVTLTVDENGVITANGTATGRIIYVVADATFIANAPSSTYFMSGCPRCGTTSTYRMSVVGATGSDTGNGVSIVYTGTISDTRVRIYIEQGFTCNNLVFKPMIRPASITDPSYQPYQGIMVERCGRNLYKTPTNRTVTISGVTFTYTAEGTIKVSGTASATVNLGILSAQSGFDQNVDTIKAGTYTISASGLNSNIVLIYGSGGNTAGITYTEFNSDNSKTFTCSDGTTGYNTLRVVSGATVNTEVKIQLEYGETAHEFETYQSASYPYTLGQSVYGGTVDLATGVLTVDMKKITLTADMNWQYSSATDRFFVVINDAVAKSGDLLFAGMCNMFKSATGNDDNSVSYINQSAKGFAIKYSALGGSLTAWEQFITDNTVEVVYELATPTTVQLTPQEVKTLLGYNNISSTGTVDVVYHADTKLYVDKMTAVDNAIIAPTEADFVASQNYTTGDLVIVNDTLYKVTSNIATGSAITPNSNVTQTTLSALIKALS